MILECLILRTGPTPVILGGSKVTYYFMPIPGAKKGEPTTSICDITKQEDLNYLLKTKQYRPYDQERSYQEMLGRRGDEDRRFVFEGMSIQKYQESGYIGIDSRNEKKRYFDLTGWKDQNINLLPFKSEFEAYEGLKLELGVEPETSPVETEGDGPISERGFEALSKITGEPPTPSASKEKRQFHHRIPR